MTPAAAGVREGSLVNRYEIPVVAARLERELDDPVGVRVANLAISLYLPESSETSTARAYHELPDPPFFVQFPLRILRGEALVVVVVARDHNLGVVCIERIPDRLGVARFTPVLDARAVAGVVEVGQGALRTVGRKVPLEPLDHRVAKTTARDASVSLRRAVALPCVQRHYVPLSKVVRVASPVALGCNRPEVVEVAPPVLRGGAAHVLVVAWGGLGAGLLCPPGILVVALEILDAPRFVGIVSDRKDRARDSFQELGRGRVVVVFPTRYIARSNQDWIAFYGHHQLRLMGALPPVELGEVRGAGAQGEAVGSVAVHDARDVVLHPGAFSHTSRIVDLRADGGGPVGPCYPSLAPVIGRLVHSGAIVGALVRVHPQLGALESLLIDAAHLEAQVALLTVGGGAVRPEAPMSIVAIRI